MNWEFIDETIEVKFEKHPGPPVSYTWRDEEIGVVEVVAGVGGPRVRADEAGRAVVAAAASGLLSGAGREGGAGGVLSGSGRGEGELGAVSADTSHDFTRARAAGYQSPDSRIGSPWTSGCRGGFFAKAWRLRRGCRRPSSLDKYDVDLRYLRGPEYVGAAVGERAGRRDGFVGGAADRWRRCGLAGGVEQYEEVTRPPLGEMRVGGKGAGVCALAFAGLV